MKTNSEFPDERASAFWNKVYIAVIVVTVAVISGLWAFSKYFK